MLTLPHPTGQSVGRTHVGETDQQGGECCGISPGNYRRGTRLTCGGEEGLQEEESQVLSSGFEGKAE